MKKVICMILLLFGSVAYSGTIDPENKDEKYVKYAEDFHYVLKITGKYKDNSSFYASVVAIKPRWVLTAAHVIQDVDTASVSDDKVNIGISSFIKHKDFIESNLGYNDIALCYLKDNLVLDFYPELYDKSDETGKICSISGYGNTGTFVTGTRIFDNKRRAGANIIDRLEKHMIICSPEKFKKTNLEFLIANGDSGGGLFIGNKLAGINSCVFAKDKKLDSSYGDEAGHTRISVFRDWINETIKKYEEKEKQ